MTKAERYIAARPLRISLVSLLFLLFTSIAAGQSEQKQDNAEDAFVAQHREAARKNPEGVSFNLRLEEDKVQFKPGEIIRLEFSFTSSLPGAYRLNGSFYDYGGRLRLDKYFLDHKNGVVDPLRDYMRGGGGGRWDNPTLSEKPHKMTFDLNEWFRFDQPGRFRLYVTAPRVLKEGEKKAGDGAEVTSNIVEFEILPRNDEWAKLELQAITRLLDSSDPNTDRRPLCHRLRFLNTEAAAREMIRRFGNPTYAFRRTDEPADVCGHEYSMGLIGSEHLAFVLKEMERRLGAPDQIVSGAYLYTLSNVAASLRRNEQARAPAEQPNDNLQARREQRELARKFQDQYTEKLMTALAGKQGKARASATHTLLETLWNDRSQSAQPSSAGPGQLGEPDPEIIKKLASEIIAVFDDLPVNIQTGLLGHQWKMLAGPAMLPVIRHILNDKQANDQSQESRELRVSAFRRIYELSPDEGRKLIIEELSRPSPNVELIRINLLPDETLPEVEKTLVENFKRALAAGTDDAYRLSLLVARHATASVAPQIREVYGYNSGKSACSIQSALLAYFLRVNAPMGVELARRAMDKRDSEHARCPVLPFYSIATLRMTPELEALAIEGLDDPDPEAAMNAAMALGEFGSTRAKEPLWKRLEKWRQEWKGREGELSKRIDNKLPNFRHKQLGMVLRQALYNSPAWLIDSEEMERLRQSCTDENELKQLDYLAGELSGEINILFSPDDFRWGSAQVAYYHSHSLSALKTKLSQFPKNTIFLWMPSGQDPSASEQVFSELKTFLEGNGMRLEEWRAYVKIHGLKRKKQ
jgi:hypothetical protein